MKNKDILLDVIGDTDEKFVPELKDKHKKNGTVKWAALGGVCAAAAIAFVIALPKINKNDNAITTYDSLPQVGNRSTMTGTEKIDPHFIFGAMGFGGLMAYDISELDTPNPWNPNLKLKSLPVYRNLAYTDIRMAVYLTEKQMQKIAKNTASALNVNINDTKVTYVKDYVLGGTSEEILNSVYSIDAKCSDHITITVYGDGKIKIGFEKHTLPSCYNFSYKNTSEDEAQKILEYLSDKFDSLLNYDNAKCYSIADRSFSGAEHRSYYVYDISDDTVQNILNYNLSYATFAPDDNGDLMCIWLNNSLCASEYLGEYPIITEDEATEQLIDGRYFSSVPNDYIRNGSLSKEDIAKTELVYCNNREKYFQPYYKYYVELNSDKLNMANGLKNYGIFYVPAIESEYLEEYDSNIEYN